MSLSLRKRCLLGKLQQLKGSMDAYIVMAAP